MAKKLTEKDRKKNERERFKEDGVVRVECKVHGDDVYQIKALEDKLQKRRKVVKYKKKPSPA